MASTLRLPTLLTPDLELRRAVDGTWLDVPAAIRELTGHERSELTGRPALELVHPDDRADVEEAVAAALRVSESCTLELRLARRDGTVLHAEARFDREGCVRLRDATDRPALEALQAQWARLFETTRRGITVTNPETLLLEAVNPAFAAMHGRPVEEFPGMPLAALLTAASAARLPALAERLAAGELAAYESEHVRRDGSRFPVAIEAFSTRGASARWLAWVDDLTERRRAEEADARHAQALARSNSDLDRFAAVVAHDLRSPLRVIAGCARILERRLGDRLDDEDRELLVHMTGGTHRMGALLDGIRNYSSVRAEPQPLRAVPLQAVVDEALAALEADLDASAARVVVGELPIVPADRVQLVQLFQNLIGNAVKFRAAEPPRISISAARAGAVWELIVADNGVGIPPDLVERVFEFGERAHGEEQAPGTGIGLAVCKAVVERHGGRIRVEPAPGGGSTFRFTLPG